MSNLQQRTKGATAQEGCNVLGTFLTFDGRFDTEVAHRLARANRTFYASWELMGTTSIPLERRLQAFRSVVGTAVFWCAGSWNLTREQH